MKSFGLLIFCLMIFSACSQEDLNQALSQPLEALNQYFEERVKESIDAVQDKLEHNHQYQLLNLMKVHDKSSLIWEQEMEGEEASYTLFIDLKGLVQNKDIVIESTIKQGKVHDRKGVIKDIQDNTDETLEDVELVKAYPEIKTFTLKNLHESCEEFLAHDPACNQIEFHVNKKGVLVGCRFIPCFEDNHQGFLGQSIMMTKINIKNSDEIDAETKKTFSAGKCVSADLKNAHMVKKCQDNSLDIENPKLSPNDENF